MELEISSKTVASSVVVQQQGGAIMHHCHVITIRVHRQHATASQVPTNDGVYCR
jgi:hypothetical protein